MMESKKDVSIDVWSTKQDSSVSLFSDWDIIHELKDRVVNVKKLNRLTLRGEVRLALNDTSEEEDQVEEDEEVDTTTFLPRRDPTLHLPKRLPSMRRIPNHHSKAKDDELMKLDLSYNTNEWVTKIPARRLSRQPSLADSDFDSGVDETRRVTSSSSSCTCGAPRKRYYDPSRRQSSILSSSSTQDISDSDWDAASTLRSSTPTPPSPTLSSSDSTKSGRRKLAPGWPHTLPELEPFTLSLDEDKIAAVTETKEISKKILVIGDSGVGKSSYLKRYVSRQYAPQYMWTVGVDFALKVLQWSENIKVKLQLWDIAGQERFTSMTRVYYKDAHACIIMFDLTQKNTFENAAKWKKDLDSKCTLPDGNPIPCMLLANKCDLEKQREVDQEKIEAFIKEHNFVGWTETSVKTGSMVDESMKFLVDELMVTYTQEPPPAEHSHVRLMDDEKTEKQTKCACS